MRPFKVNDAYDALQALPPYQYAIVMDMLTNQWAVKIQGNDRLVLRMAQAKEEDKQLAEFFIHAPEWIEHLLEHITHLEKVINDKTKQINVLHDRREFTSGKVVERELDNTRFKLNNALMENEKLQKEVSYLRGMARRMGDSLYARRR